MSQSQWKTTAKRISSMNRSLSREADEGAATTSATSATSSTMPKTTTTTTTPTPTPTTAAPAAKTTNPPTTNVRTFSTPNPNNPTNASISTLSSTVTTSAMFKKSWRNSQNSGSTGTGTGAGAGTPTAQSQTQAQVLPPTLKHVPKGTKETHGISTSSAIRNQNHKSANTFTALFRQSRKSSTNKQLPGQLPGPAGLKQKKNQNQPRKESKALFVGNEKHSSLSKFVYYGGYGHGQGDGGIAKKLNDGGVAKKSASAQRRHTVPSGYVNVPEFANDVVEDPFEMHTMIQDTTKRLYIFWVFIIVAASLLNALLLFIFRHMDPIFAVDFLRKILLNSPYNSYGLVGVTVSFLILAVWGCVMLSHPLVSNSIVANLRWAMALLLITYILFCIGDQMSQCMNLHANLKAAMLKDFNTGTAITKLRTGVKGKQSSGSSPVSVIKFKQSRIETLTQDYLQCCGVENKDDWKKLRPLTSSPDGPSAIPVSCCDERSYPGCSARNLDLADSAESIWPDGCLKHEYTCIVIIMVIVGGIEMFCIISVIFACVVLSIVLRHTNELQVTHVHPFGQG